MTRLARCVLILLLVLSAVRVLSVRPASAAPRSGPVIVRGARFPSSLVSTGDGGFLYAERLTGRIRRVSAAGRLAPRPAGRVSVATDGQRGLLGLAVDAQARIFAAWTDAASGTIRVGQVAPGAARLVWQGPQSADRANGGHIELAPDGRIVIGIGDLLHRPLVADPATPNGKLLALDPDAGPGQVPAVISGGWNNPFAFTFTPGGQLWVADNTGKRGPERLARGDVGGKPTSITALPRETAPSGITAVSDDELLVCGFVSRTLTRWNVTADGTAKRAGARLTTDCSLQVIVVGRRIVYSNESSIRRLAR